MAIGAEHGILRKGRVGRSDPSTPTAAGSNQGWCWIKLLPQLLQSSAPGPSPHPGALSASSPSQMLLNPFFSSPCTKTHFGTV